MKIDISRDISSPFLYRLVSPYIHWWHLSLDKHADLYSYKIESWGQVLLKLSAGPNIYRNTITLVELSGQNTMEDLDAIPTPSQMDNFIIYNKMIENDIKAREGEAAYKEYKSSEGKKEAVSN